MKTPDRKGTILAAAGRVFEANGYAATTIDAVAAEAGISKGSVYNYFPSKQDLFAEVFVAAVSGMEADVVERIAETPGGETKLRQLLDYWFGRVEYSMRIGGLVLEFWATAAREDQQGKLAVTFRRMYARWRELIGNILVQGVEAGEFSRQFDPAVAASLIMAVLDGILVQSILDVGVNVNEDFLAAMKRAMMAALKAR